MSLPEIATYDEWRAAREDLLAKEKALTKARDALSTARRELPMVRIEKDYAFEGVDGPATLLDLFDGKRQLVVGHFMFDPSWDDGCPSCSAGADEMAPGLRAHLEVRDTRLVYVSRAPSHKLEDYKARKGWTFPWYSSGDGDFNYDFGVTIDATRGSTEFNFRPVPDDWDQPCEMPGMSCFLRDGDDVFHTYSSYARGAEWLGGSYAVLDLTALGRQEEWEEPKGRADLERSATPNFKD